MFKSILCFILLGCPSKILSSSELNNLVKKLDEKLVVAINETVVENFHLVSEKERQRLEIFFNEYYRNKKVKIEILSYKQEMSSIWISPNRDSFKLVTLKDIDIKPFLIYINAQIKRIGFLESIDHLGFMFFSPYKYSINELDADKLLCKLNKAYYSKGVRFFILESNNAKIGISAMTLSKKEAKREFLAFDCKKP